MNTYIRDDLLYLYAIANGVTFSGTYISRGSNQSISDSTVTSITLLSEAFDYGGWWASGTDVIVPAGAIPSGYTTIAVLILGRLQWATNGTGIRRVSIYKNGSEVDRRTVAGLAGDTTESAISILTTCVAADVFTIRGEQTSGGALNMTGANFTVVRYAPAA